MGMFRNLRADEIECRVSQINEKYVTLLLYKDARCDMNILDETVGAMNWMKKYSRDNANCSVGIFNKDRGEWVWKEDVGTENYTEKEKSIASDSFKRASVCWGIGRELYSAPRIQIDAPLCGVWKKDGKWVTYNHFYVSKIGYDDSDKISSLTIVNEDSGKVIYEFDVNATKKAKQKKAAEKKEAKPTKNDLKALREEFAKEGIREDFVLALYKRDSLEEMDEERLENIVRNLKKIKEEQDVAGKEDS